ncbi:SICA antigen [Plasmodium coatneyi]|uniref:SICA antigen n=1 Tax=Plasmodium coatneyi TaxID=208452 RepID=A0A1B1E4Z9_9APIC|nr:SICA antigen [Plasmodium coatneyi]ANQ10093.1 SICA antigen [Plasmodium coatneyi]
MLNVYAQEIKDKCPLMGKTVQQAFTIHEGLRTTACSSGTKNCVQCEWDECANYNLNGNEGVDLRRKVKDMLLGKDEITKTMSTISDSSTIKEWFTLFSEDVRQEDNKEKYSELNFLLPLCDDLNSTLGKGMSKYESFCRIMIRNIILTTAVEKKYEDKDQTQEKGQAPCEKIDVIIQALSRVKTVRETLNENVKYTECAYDAALKIAYTGQTHNSDDPHYIFETSELHTMMETITKDKTWCVDKEKLQQRRKALEDPDRSRAETGEKVQIRNGAEELEDLKKIFENVNETVEEEVKKEAKKPETDSPPPAPQEPVAEDTVPKVEEEEEEEEEEEDEEDEDEVEEVAEEPAKDKEDEEENNDQAEEEIPATEENDATTAPEGHDHSLAGGGGSGEGGSRLATPKAEALIDMKDNPFFPYLPLAPAMLGISVMSYLLWKHFGMLRKTRKRYRRAPKALGPTLEQQIVDHVEQQDGPHEYYLVKERKPRSTPIRRRKKRVAGHRRAGRRGVRRRMIIDIHLEVLDEWQKGDLHSMKEDFFEILVQEFMGSKYMEEENVPKEQVPSLDSAF